MIESFHFMRPGWLLLLLPAAFVLWRAWRSSAADTAWRKIVAPELLPHLLLQSDHSQRSAVAAWVGAGITLAIFALAGPTWERLPQPVFNQQSALVIALDLSKSMDARDVKPSRLARAKFKLRDILQRRKDGQTALVVFAATPFTVAPLTDDVKTIEAQLPALSTNIMPAQGSNTAAAIGQAVQLLVQAQQKSGDILLITDGANTDASVKAAQKAAKQGYAVHVLAVGSEQGAPIPGRHGVLKDAAGNIVLAKVEMDALQKVAAAGGGRFAALSTNDSDLAILDLEKNQRVAGKQLAQGQELPQWRDMGPWLLLLVLPLMALAFRRGVLFALILVAAPLPHPAQAGWWEDLWQRPDQQAQQLLKAHQAKMAAEKFRDPDWKASALYQSGDYAAAEALWNKGTDAQAFYNKGNALAHEGKLKAAISAYEQALKRDPQMTDAKANKALLEKLLQQQEQQQQKNDQRNSKDQKQGNDQQPQQNQQNGKDQQKQQKQNSSKNKQSQQQQQGGKQKDKAQQQSDTQPQGQQGQPQDKERQQQQQAANPESKDEQKQTEAAPPAMSKQEQEKKERQRQAAEAAQKKAEEKAEKERQAQLQAKPEQAKDRQDDDSRSQQQAMATTEMPRPQDERSLSREQWLRRVPDDPGGLLRNKFKYYYQRQQYETPSQPW